MKMSGKIRTFIDKVAGFLSGDKLIEWGLDRQLGFLVYVFSLVCLFIAWSLSVEQNLVRVQENERTLQELRISYQQRTLDLVGMNNRTRVDGMLRARGSQLHAPTAPPERIILEK